LSTSGRGAALGNATTLEDDSIAAFGAVIGAFGVSFGTTSRGMEFGKVVTTPLSALRSALLGAGLKVWRRTQ